MARIDIKSSSTGGTVATGVLQLASGVAMSSTLEAVTDQNNTASQFKLAIGKQVFNGSLSVGTTDTPANTRLFIKGEDQLNTSGALRIQDSANVDIAVITNAGNMIVGNGGVPLAKLQVDSTTSGFLPPRMTNAQKNAITSPAEGLIVHDTTNNGVAYYDGSTWGYLSGAKQTLTASGGTLNIPFRNGNIVDLTLVNPNVILTLTTHVVGTYIIKVTQGGVGNCTITWPASVKWTLGVAPTLSTAVGKVDIITLFHDGTNFYGTYSLNY
jgi:hypothetical protein